jgi:hypothetical protein
MPPYQRDPLSEWFDGAASDWLARAYRTPGKWVTVYLAPPSKTRRALARTMGEPDLDKRDRWGEIRWVRAYKRAVYWNHKNYGYAESFRPGEARAADTAATGLRWETLGLLRKAGWPTRRRELAIMIVPPGDAMAAAAARPASQRYDLDERYRSKPGPPDRPWDG